MAYSNADKQRRHRQRLKARGLAHVQGWVTPPPAAAIRRILADRSAGPSSPRTSQDRAWAAENENRDQSGRKPGFAVRLTVE